MKLPQVIFVTGKGGTGKSTVVAALARAAARYAPVTVIELDRRRCASQVLGAAEPAAHAIELLALGARTELEGFIERIVPLKAIARRLLRSRTFGLVAAALPGLEAFLLLERIRSYAARAEPERVVVVDAQASGSALELLNVPAAVRRLAPVGTLHRLAAEADNFLRDSARFAALLVVHPEELALNEALETRARLETLGIACTACVLNRCTTALFSSGEIARLRSLSEHQRLARNRQRAAAAALRAERRLRRAGLEPLKLPMLYCAELRATQLDSLSRILDKDLFSR